MTQGKRLTDQELRATCRLVKEFGVRGAAREMGVDGRAVRHHLALATSRNITGDFQGAELPVGYHMGKVTVHRKDNEVVEEWQRLMPDAEAMYDLFDALMDEFKREVTPLPETPAADLYRNSDWMTLYPVVDVHLGQHSWGKETGRDYDLAIARDQFIKATTWLVTHSPASNTALIVVLGDFYHANNNDAQTKKSHNHLDVDGRHDKVLHVGVELIVTMVDLAMQKHLMVVVHVCRGNHDEDSSKVLREALWWRYSGNGRVTVDSSTEDLWCYEFGKVMLGFTHGDMMKAEDMPASMAAQKSEMWGRTEYRYAFSGHWHRNKKGPLADEKNGARYEILPAFTEKDAWNRAMGHNSIREMLAITFDRKTGRKHTDHTTI